VRIYVGNLPFDVTSEELREQFAAYGNVESVDVVTDKYSGRSKGFAFVEMPAISEGQAAINGLNGKTLKDRTMNVSAARAREDRGGPSRGGGRGGFDRGSRRY
jgi:RNA recognition motif-containing protein